MLIKCPECGKSISDRALSCPNCGFPVSEIESNTESRPNRSRITNESESQARNVNPNVNSKRAVGQILPSKNVRVRVYMGKNSDGKKIWKSFTAKTKKDAQEAANKYKVTHKLEDIHTENFTKAMEHFFVMKSPVLSPSSIRGYRSLQKMLLKDFQWLCNKKIDDIDKTDVQTVINELVEEVKPKTVANYAGFISSVLSLYDIKLPKVTLPQKQKPDFYIPDESDLNRLFEAVEGTELEIPILLGALGPLRRGEIWALTLDDIEGNVIHVKNDVVIDENFDVVKKETAKTYSSDRYVEFPEYIIDKIREKGYVVKISMKGLNFRLDRVLEREGLPHFRFHDLRHAFVSIAHANGIPDAEIQRRGGWATNHVMNNVYRHSLEQTAKETVDKINQLFPCHTRVTHL